MPSRSPSARKHKTGQAQDEGDAGAVPRAVGVLPPEALARAMELAAGCEQGKASRLAELYEEWRSLEQQLAAMQEENDQRRDAAGELEQELAFMNRELEARQRETQQRSSTMTDASALAQLRAAITTLQAELRDIDVRIGVTSSLLLDAAVGAA